MIKRLRVAVKVSDVEDTFRRGEVVFLEVVVETCAWTPKVWNARGWTQRQ